MAVVEVLPSGIRFEVREGESILDAAQRQGVKWPTICRGRASCRVCACEVPTGSEAIGAMGRLEKRGLSSLYLPVRDGYELRLACQVTVSGDVVVRKESVHLDRAEVETP